MSAEFRTRLLAKSDAFGTRIRRDAFLQTRDTSNGSVEVHRRGQVELSIFFATGKKEKPVGVLEPDGHAIVGDKNAIVHTYTDEAQLDHRFPLKRPPEGYQTLTAQDIERLAERTFDQNTTEDILRMEPREVRRRLGISI